MKTIVLALLTANTQGQRVDFSQFTKGFLPKQLLGQKCNSQLPFLGCNQFAVLPSGQPLFQNQASPRAIAQASGKSIYKVGTDTLLSDTTPTNPAGLAEDSADFDPCLTTTASKGLTCLAPLALRCQAPEDVTQIRSGADTCILASDCGYDWIVDGDKSFVGDKPIPDICPRRNSREVQDYTKRYFNTLQASGNGIIVSLADKRKRVTDFDQQCADTLSKGTITGLTCDINSPTGVQFDPVYKDAVFDESTGLLTQKANFELDDLEYKDYCSSVVTPSNEPPATAFINAIDDSHTRQTRHCDAKYQTLAGTVLAALAISLAQ